MEFSDSFAVAGSGGFVGFFERHGVGTGRVFLTAKGTEAAGSYANIRRVNVAIDVEICFVPVETLAHVIGQPADSEDVPSTVENESVVSRQALARENLFGDGFEARVFGLELVLAWHFSMISQGTGVGISG